MKPYQLVEKKFEERDDTVISNIAIIEAERSSKIDVKHVDDENLLNLVCLKEKETYQDVLLSKSLKVEQQADVMRLLKYA